MSSEVLITAAVALIVGIFGTTGFWGYISRRYSKKTSHDDLLLGIGHDKISHLCKLHIKAGYISPGDFDDLYNYLYMPYRSCGGNGAVERLMEIVKKLPNEPTKTGLEP